ncbi:MAG: hypothetical protein R2788_18190 [Saprospiraceae bacterium]
MKRVYFLYFALLFLSHQAINAQIVNIEERRIKGTNDSTFWYGSLRLGANISKGKTKYYSLTPRDMCSIKGAISDLVAFGWEFPPCW